MTTVQQIDPQEAAAAIKKEVSKNWWILLVQGIAAILLGVLLLMNPPATLVAIAWVLGIFWLIGGVMDIIGAFTGKNGNRHWYWQLLGGAFSIIAGLLLIIYPMIGAAVLPAFMTLLIGVGAILGGIFNIIGAIMMRKEINGEFWMIVWGLILLLLGLWAVLNLGAATLLYIGVMAIMIIVGGIAAIFGSFRLRSLGKS